MTREDRRTTAEWVTFAASSAVLLVVVALIALQMLGTDDPPAPVATTKSIREVAGAFHVDVSVRNDGDDTAANVQISADLTVGGNVSTGDQTIDFLAGAEVADIVFVFDDDPREGELVVVVTGYAAP